MRCILLLSLSNENGTMKQSASSGDKRKQIKLFLNLHLLLSNIRFSPKREMATDKLTTVQIALLATEIDNSNMNSIAQRYLGFRPEKLRNLHRKHREDVEAINRDILTMWKYQNHGANQKQVISSSILCSYLYTD